MKKFEIQNHKTETNSKFECLNAGNRFEYSDLEYSNLFRVSGFEFRALSAMRSSGQSMIEFTFAMVGVLVLFYGLIMVFRWAGLDLAERRFAHDHLFENSQLRPEQQLNPDFFKPRKIDGSFRGFDLK